MEISRRKPLEPIRHNTLQQQVYRRIRENLADGQFKPGEILTIRELAAQLGTSVMPVREALHKLTVEQVLDLTPNRSVRVPTLTPEKFAEICDARMIIEGNLARLAAQRADDADLARIDAANREFGAAKVARDPMLLLQKNREFHFAIYEAAHQPTLMNMIEPLWVRCGPSTFTLFDELGPEQIKKSATNPHRAVVEAIRGRRAAEAQQAIIADIRATSERYQKHFEKERALDQRAGA
ncbi:MAG TPA: GntR family transcriptional regulator [Steroidobacteraceae bacterium]|jgi:DNA-binding GntR family transcriptional regulator|nr:GntR family transcriptional regulator [Steroidobacteraceae bacterium]